MPDGFFAPPIDADHDDLEALVVRRLSAELCARIAAVVAPFRTELVELALAQASAELLREKVPAAQSEAAMRRTAGHLLGEIARAA